MERSTLYCSIAGFAAGIGFGASIMYLLDPDRGNRRRAQVKDQMLASARDAAQGARSQVNDLRNRSKGKVHEWGRRVGPDSNVDDEKLVARVRSVLGHRASNPSVIEVTSKDQEVTLHGPILAHEVDDLLHAVRAVPGVRRLDNRLEIHPDARGVEGLSDAPSRSTDSSEALPS